MYLLKILTITITFCVLTPFVYSNDLRILFTGQLNGYLETCECGIELTPGFVKQGYFINQYKKKYPSAVVIDTGNVIKTNLKSKKILGIFEALNHVPYDGILPGENELTLSPKKLLEVSNNLPWVLSNIRIKKGIFSKTKAIGKQEINISKNNFQIKILGMWGKNRLNQVFYSDKSELKFFDWENFIKKNSQDLLIILTRESFDFTQKLSKSLTHPTIIFGDYKRSFVKKGMVKKLSPNTWFVSSGKNGGNVGELIVKIKSKKIQSVTVKYHVLDPEKAKDDPKIQKIVKRLGL